MDRDIAAEANPPRLSPLLMAVSLAALVVGTLSGVGQASDASEAKPSLVASGGPIVPGLHGDHPLESHQVGEVLIGELACANCHDSLAPLTDQVKQAPDLSEVGSRVSLDYLERYLLDPQAAHPGTTMPSVLHGIEIEAMRTEIAGSIAHYLRSLAPEGPRFGAASEEDRVAGEKLYHAVGCVSCHASRDGSETDARPGMKGLDHVASKYSLESLTQFLFHPLEHRPSGRMPDMSLSRVEAKQIASFLVGTTVGTTQPYEAIEDRVANGMVHFQEQGCVSCHVVDDFPMSAPASRAIRDLDAGCLSESPGMAPDFGLTAEQREAIRATIRIGASERSAEHQWHVSLTTFNCIACHTRDDFGGVPAELNAYFQTDELALGDPARIPPPLTRVGAKLRPEWLGEVLFEGASVRPYMHTRMPQYGDANLGHLPELARAVDPAPPIEIPVFRGKQRGEMHNAAQQLVGSDMLACINCHSFNGKKSPAFNGIDLTTTAERLQPAWLKEFLINPQAHRPGIIMPQSWPGGEALRQDVLDGDTEKQIDAIWSYLEQGRTARDPKGIRNEPTRLVVTDEVQTYRGRSRIAGFRGIAVGFPEGLNYSFNAETGAWSGIWKGGYVRVRWDSQGAGDFNPDARPIELPRDLGVTRLASDEEPWPLLPVMTEEEPVNPDPLYPRRLGYRFRGYSLDEAKVPTLNYLSEGVAIQDKTISTPGFDGISLTRTMSFDAPEAETLYVRLAAGPIEVLTESQFKLGPLMLEVPPGPVILRPSAVEGEKELLLKLALPQGSTSIEVRYEVL